MAGIRLSARRIQRLTVILAVLLGVVLATLTTASSANAAAAGKSVARDTSRIQNLLNNPVKGLVDLPKGTFTIRPSLRLRQGVRIIGHGTTFKVAPGSGDYKAILAGVAPATDLTGLSITGVTFDQNSRGNPAARTGPLFHGKPRYVILLGAGSNISITNNRFVDTDNVNSVVTGSATRNVAINRNVFLAGDLLGHDHSSIYTSGTSTVIRGNTLRGRVMYGSAAIEVHGTGATVADNHVQGYYRGANIASSNTVFTNNKVIGALNPVDLWSVAAPGLSNVTVTHNTLNRNLKYWAGILRQHGRPLPPPRYTKQVIRDESSTYGFHNITIFGNTG